MVGTKTQNLNEKHMQFYQNCSERIKFILKQVQMQLSINTSNVFASKQWKDIKWEKGKLREEKKEARINGRKKTMWN